MIDHTIKYSLLDTFDENLLAPETWNNLVSKSSRDIFFMTWQWQKVWWEAWGRGKLLLIVAEQDGELIAIAPLFADEDMIFFVGSGWSDYLNFIGNSLNPDIVEGMLLLAIKSVPGFVGCRFYHIDELSSTSAALDNVAQRQGWVLHNEGEIVAPYLDIKEFPEIACETTQKKSLLRDEGWFIRNGDLKIEHLNKSEDILPHLDAFFQQDILRRDGSLSPSPFTIEKHCSFFKRICDDLSETGWLRFTRLIWNEENIAFHFGFNYMGNYIYCKPCFDKRMAKYSPGGVLLRQLILNAIDEQAHSFDFGLGDENYKKRFATNNRLVQNWGLYPKNEKQN